MPIFRTLISRAARELAQNPEARAKAKQVFDQELKPRAQKFLHEHESDIQAAKQSAVKNAAKLAATVKARLREK